MEGACQMLLFPIEKLSFTGSISEAKNWLKKDKTISQIAFDLGFEICLTSLGI
jgi:hypothetical protein